MWLSTVLNRIMRFVFPLTFELCVKPNQAKQPVTVGSHPVDQFSINIDTWWNSPSERQLDRVPSVLLDIPSP